MNAESDFVSYAGQLGLNVNQFMQSMRLPETEQRILRDVARATDAKINETPTFYINGQKLTSRPPSVDELSKLVQDAIPRK